VRADARNSSTHGGIDCACVVAVDGQEQPAAHIMVDHAHFLAEAVELALVHGFLAWLAVGEAPEHSLDMN
jgi:hypothetical protein